MSFEFQMFERPTRPGLPPRPPTRPGDKNPDLRPHFTVKVKKGYHVDCKVKGELVYVIKITGKPEAELKRHLEQNE